MPNYEIYVEYQNGGCDEWDVDTLERAHEEADNVRKDIDVCYLSIHEVTYNRILAEEITHVER